MKRRPLLFALVILALALPAAASQFAHKPFDELARDSSAIVRGTIVDTWSSWNESRDIIFTYATVRVDRYLADTTGPDTIIVREVGGTVDDYTQEAVGFPALRQGERVVLFLTRWEDTGDYRINAYNEGKYLVRMRGETEMAMPDARTQGHELETDGRRFRMAPNAAVEAEETGLTMTELVQMVEMARMGGTRDAIDRD